MESKKVPVTITFASNEKEVELELGGGILSPHDVLASLQLDASHAAHITVSGLVVNGDKRVLFEPTDELPFPHAHPRHRTRTSLPAATDAFCSSTRRIWHRRVRNSGRGQAAIER